MASVGASGVVLPTEVTESISAAALEPAPPQPATAIQFQGAALPGGVSAIPIDASTYLQIQVLPNPTYPNPSGGVNISLTAKILSPDGSITNCQYTQNFSVTAGTTQVYDLAPGYLISVAVTCQNAGIPDGALFVIAGLIHQPNAGLPLDALLCASYLSSYVPVGWPEGILRTISDGNGFPASVQSATPGVGVQPTYTIVDAYFQVVGIEFELTTDAVAGSRYVSAFVNPPVGAGTGIGAAPAVQGPGTTVAYLLGPGLAQFNSPLGTGQTIATPDPLLLAMGDLIGISASNLDPNDQFTALTVHGRAWL